jgi:UDP-N-acetyl-D-glucosamine 4,6-dehydratase
MGIDKRVLNFLMIIVLSTITFIWTFWIFHESIRWDMIGIVIIVRLMASFLLFQDYSLSWSKASQKTFILKSIVYIIAFVFYMPIFYSKVHLYFFISELFVYLFSMNFLMYGYYLFINRSSVAKTKSVVIYGAGKAGLKLEEELGRGEYKVQYFVDDDILLQKRSIDGIKIISKERLKQQLENKKLDLLVIALPSNQSNYTKEIYEELHDYFRKIQILPTLHNILQDKPMVQQLKEVSVTELLARHPQDLDKNKISSFIKGKVVAITGAGGSIGSEIARQCVKFEAKKLILIDHSEYNLYQIEQEISKEIKLVPIMQSVVHKSHLQKTFQKYRPHIVIHAAAYKHVPMVEENVEEAIINNIVGTKNAIDVAIEYEVEKFVLISTDKAVRPTNVMGATKRVCELYVQNVISKKTEVVAVRFGNVLGSSGSVIPKFKEQITNGQHVTVTHPEITRYFMLIPEACELVLQAGALGKGGEIFILDMGEPVKIVDLAQKMIELSGREDVSITFTGLRPGEKLYEELLIDEAEMHTEYDSITVATATEYEIETLNHDIDRLLKTDDKVDALQTILPEFNHMPHNGNI